MLSLKPSFLSPKRARAPSKAEADTEVLEDVLGRAGSETFSRERKPLLEEENSLIFKGYRTKEHVCP